MDSIHHLSLFACWVSVFWRWLCVGHASWTLRNLLWWVCVCPSYRPVELNRAGGKNAERLRAFPTQANKTISVSSPCREKHIGAPKFTRQAAFLVSVKLFSQCFFSHKQSCDSEKLQSSPCFSNEVVDASDGLQGYQALWSGALLLTWTLGQHATQLHWRRPKRAPKKLWGAPMGPLLFLRGLLVVGYFEHHALVGL